MSWGIDFKADIYLSRQNYNENEYYVQEEIDRLGKRNQEIKEVMLMMVMGGASSVSMKDEMDNECDAVDVLHIKFSSLLQEYEENLSQIGDLYYYKEYLKDKERKP